MNLRKLLGLCEHDWKVISQYGVFCTDKWIQKQEQVATEYHQQCSKCKKMRKYTL